MSRTERQSRLQAATGFALLFEVEIEMKRIYKPQLGWENDMRVNVPTCAVVEPTPVEQYSGLLDASGNRLMVTLKSEPAGFVVFSEK